MGARSGLVVPSEVGSRRCSPVSGTCYAWKNKAYYEAASFDQLCEGLEMAGVILAVLRESDLAFRCLAGLVRTTKIALLKTWQQHVQDSSLARTIAVDIDK